MSVDFHPGQFNVINSDKENVVKNTIKNLSEQVEIFEALNYKEDKMVIHIGEDLGGKEEATKRFIYNIYSSQTE